ncbi:MAG: hypothetical protein KAS72_03970 [Phycisphaerales bacterium]|nr:hypothetical protein [Phycisphaerales bacterium]
MPGTLRFSAAILVACCAVAAGDPPDPPAETAPSIQPERALGLRVRHLDTAWPTTDLVVLVPDEASYIAAIAAWSPAARWPVLIENDAGRADIARFVRAFRPERVVRLASVGSLPAPGEALRAAIVAAACEAWDVPDVESLADSWADRRFAPPGVIITSDAHPAWAAALALAAGRGQPIIWSDLPQRSVNTAIAPEHLDRLRTDLQAGLESLDYPWRSLGDAIDAVTICLNVPGRVPIPEQKAALALTDVVGRHDDSSRFAYTGWIFADSPARAAYQAMCALFLQPSSAMLFDGYTDGEPWAHYTVNPAAELLTKVGFDTQIIAAPNGDLSAWRRRTSGGLKASFIHINTMGNAPYFDLARSTKGWARDIPPLHVPAAVHIIHSWSAHSPGDPNTIAGRWLEHGAYCYVGSVHEPYLGAFVTPTELVGRLLAGEPWGAAPRHIGAKPWKINIIGDPLHVFAPRLDRLPASTLNGEYVDLQTTLEAHLRDRKFPEAIRELTLLGRDADAVKLLAAVLAEDKIQRMGEIAWSGLGAAFRAGDRAMCRRLYIIIIAPDGPIITPTPTSILTAEQARSPSTRWARDLLWSKLGSDLHAASETDLALLQLNLREKRPELDAIRLANELARRGRKADAIALLTVLRQRITDAQQRQRIDRAIARLR